MEDREEADQVGDDALDAGLKEAFLPNDVDSATSILEAIQKKVGFQSRILLREPLDEHSPVIKVRPRSDEERAENNARYEIVGEIARGGVGVVFKARDKDLGREVATKVLRSDIGAAPAIVERFIEEAQIEGQLQNPGIVPVYDVGLQEDGRPYFVMKLVKGRTLSALLGDRAGPETDRRRFIRIFEQVCQTLAYVHTRGVIHRDLKPANIMVGAFGEVQVVDWGFAKVLGSGREGGQPPLDLSIIATLRTGAEGSQSVAGSVMGTPAYMPPEQAMGDIDALDERADVFGLGAILCEILTGKPPYVGAAEDLLVMAAQSRLEDAYARLDACGADGDLTALVRDCLAPEKADRPRNAAALARAIADHLASVDARARDAEVEAMEERAREEEARRDLEREESRADWERRARRRTLALAATVLAAVMVAGGGYLWMEQRQSDRADRATAAAQASIEKATLAAGKERWDAAIGAAETADQLARDADAETRRRTAELLAGLLDRKAALDAAAARADRDRRLVARLDETIAVMGRRRIPYLRERAYRAAVRDYGADIDRLTADEAIAALGKTAIAAELARLFDHWATLGPPDRAKLQAIALGLDRDPWRTQLREAVRDGDRAFVTSLVASPGVRTLPKASVALLGQSLLAIGEPEPAAALLDDALDRFVSDFAIHALAADAASMATPPRWTGSARHLTAAATLRPDSLPTRVSLAAALLDSGDVAGALPAFEAAAADDPGAAAKAALLERMMKLLPALKAGQLGTADDLARRDFAELLLLKGRYAEASAAYEALGTSREAAAAAALAGCGADAQPLDEAEQARLRGRALDSLRLVLADLRRKSRDTVEQLRDFGRRGAAELQVAWYFYAVRDEPFLSRLPEKEAAEWRAFWVDVDTVARQG